MLHLSLISSVQRTRSSLSVCHPIPHTSSSHLTLAATLLLRCCMDTRYLNLDAKESFTLISWSFYTYIQGSNSLSDQNIKSGFQATGLIPYCPERVLTCLTVVRTLSPLRTTTGKQDVWTAETPHTTDQLDHQARLLRLLLDCPSQSPTSQALTQLVKGCQLAMHSATMLAEENTKLRATQTHQRQKKSRRRQYIASGGVLQAQEGQALVAAAQMGVQESSQVGTADAQTRAPPTCSKCHVQGHNRTQCRTI
jgi:hypothetical protein